MLARRLLLVLLGTLVGCAAPSDGDTSAAPAVDDGKADSATPRPVPYRGGAVLHHPREIHLYWGGYWATSDGLRRADLLDGFAASVGGTRWFAITSQYGDGRGGPATDENIAGASATFTDTDPPSLVGDAAIRGLLAQQLDERALPWNAEGVYVVFLPPHVVVATRWGRSCDAICAYHHHFAATVQGRSVDVKYAVVPALDCASSCGVRGLHVNSPTVDQMTLALSHELAETVTDPDIDAWTGPHGDGEIGDRCDGGFSATWDGQSYAVQQLWSNATLRCVNGR